MKRLLGRAFDNEDVQAAVKSGPVKVMLTFSWKPGWWCFQVLVGVTGGSADGSGGADDVRLW